MADAISEGCDTVSTGRRVQSNHARATALVAKELGLQAHVFLRTTEHDHPEEHGSKGNFLFHRILGVQMHLLGPVSYLVGMPPKMIKLQGKLAAEGKNAYLIGIGGSNEVGLWRYIEAFKELLSQGVQQFTDVVVVVCAGTGGTISGLTIANYLSGSPVRVHGVTVAFTRAYFYEHVNEMLAKLCLDNEVDAEDLLYIIEANWLGYD